MKIHEFAKKRNVHVKVFNALFMYLTAITYYTHQANSLPTNVNMTDETMN